MQHEDDPETTGPSEVDDPEQRALRGALGPLFDHARPPAELRGRLRETAEARFTRRPRLRLLPKVAAVAAACAAAGLAYVLVTGRGAGPAGDTAVAERPAGASEVPLAADVDSSGAVDIFDAYLVARAVRGGDVSGLPDLDGDGQTTQLDADLIAARAVELPR